VCCFALLFRLAQKHPNHVPRRHLLHCQEGHAPLWKQGVSR
jgi:hypothetical protein